MKYAVLVQTEQIIEVEAKDENAAVQLVTNRVEPKGPSGARFSIIRECSFDEETKTCKPL